MGLTKQYLKYISGGNANLIASSKCNPIFVILEAQEGRFVAVGACEHIYIWDLRLGEKAQVLSGEKASVTCLAASPNKRHIAAGYDDGSVRTFDLRSGENISIFVGHRSEVTTLSYDFFGHKLVSGSKDTDVIVWDVVAESGVCRLTGHKSTVTQVSFLPDHNIVISSSKDSFIKFWDIDTEHNFKTIIGHRSEVYGFAMVQDGRYLVSGCKDNYLYVWFLYFKDEPDSDITSHFKNLSIDDDETDDLKYPLRCVKIGQAIRAGKGRLLSIVSDTSGQVIGCHGNDNILELFYFLPEDEAKERSRKRLKKSKEKKDGNVDDSMVINESGVALKDILIRFPVIHTGNKIKGLNLIMGRENELRVCSTLATNSIELHSLTVTEKNPEAKMLRSLNIHGHRSDVRAICFSSDNIAFATVSGESVKLWNRPTLACLRTVECGYGLSIAFVPGDRHLIVGMMNGKVLIIDIAAGDILEEIPAHEREVWSTNLIPDLKGVITASGDKTVKFWQFELVEDSNHESKVKVLSLLHYKTLKLEEGVLCSKISPNNKFIAVSLLDSTVKIFFVDTLKFFISLYGHKLPVLCLDISSDSTLIATGSADRNIKIWGMDFGDCHKSLFAHDDSVTSIGFVPKTHYLFTSGKDGKIKEWDADIFQKIITLQGHSGQAFNLAISPNGKFVASCGSDKVIRLYERSDEILVLEDEAEEEREKQENELSTGESTTVPGQKQQVLPTRKTVNSEKAAELLLECLDVSKMYKEECSLVPDSKPKPPVPMMMKVYKVETIEDYLLETLKRIKASDLDEALLLLPFSAATEIIKLLPNLLMNVYQTELLVKVALSLIQIHHKPLVVSEELLPYVEKIKSLAFSRINELRDIVGFNLYGMDYLQGILEEREGVQLFREAASNRKKKMKQNKRKEKATKRAIMSLGT